MIGGFFSPSSEGVCSSPPKKGWINSNSASFKSRPRPFSAAWTTTWCIMFPPALSPHRKVRVKLTLGVRNYFAALELSYSRVVKESSYLARNLCSSTRLQPNEEHHQAQNIAKPKRYPCTISQCPEWAFQCPRLLELT